MTPLGTDGFGRSEARAALRWQFEVDAEFIAVATLDQLAKRGEVKADSEVKAIKELGKIRAHLRATASETEEKDPNGPL